VDCSTHAFQACALDHYANPPNVSALQCYTRKITLGEITPL